MWVAKVHHFVEQFVNDYKVVTDRLFFEFLEVFGEDFHNLVQEQQDFCSIGVAFRQGEEVQVVVPYVEVLFQR